MRMKMIKLCHLREWVWLTEGLMPILQHTKAWHILVWNSLCLMKAKASLPKGAGRKPTQLTKNSALFFVDLHWVRIFKPRYSSELGPDCHPYACSCMETLPICSKGKMKQGNPFKCRVQPCAQWLAHTQELVAEYWVTLAPGSACSWCYNLSKLGSWALTLNEETLLLPNLHQGPQVGVRKMCKEGTKGRPERSCEI